jgi:predicted membrane protein
MRNRRRSTASFEYYGVCEIMHDTSLSQIVIILGLALAGLVFFEPDAGFG